MIAEIHPERKFLVKSTEYLFYVLDLEKRIKR